MQSRLNPFLTFKSRLDESQHLVKVVIAYDQLSCGLRAMRLYERIASEFGTECHLKLDLWRFEVLGLPDVADIAGDAAAAADLVILSVDAQSELPFECKTWIESWIDRRVDEDGALVALINCAGADDGGSDSPQTFFREIARRARMQFFSDSASERHVSDPADGPLIEPVSSNSPRRRMSLEEIVCHPEAHPR